MEGSELAEPGLAVSHIEKEHFQYTLTAKDHVILLSLKWELVPQEGPES